jgi:hypothetical protein
MDRALDDLYGLRPKRVGGVPRKLMPILQRFHDLRIEKMSTIFRRDEPNIVAFLKISGCSVCT